MSSESVKWSLCHVSMWLRVEHTWQMSAYNLLNWWHGFIHATLWCQQWGAPLWASVYTARCTASKFEEMFMHGESKVNAIFIVLMWRIHDLGGICQCVDFEDLSSFNSHLTLPLTLMDLENCFRVLEMLKYVVFPLGKLILEPQSCPLPDSCYVGFCRERYAMVFCYSTIGADICLK